MAYKYYNPNNRHRDDRGDCVIRAISIITDQSWGELPTRLKPRSFD